MSGRISALVLTSLVVVGCGDPAGSAGETGSSGSTGGGETGVPTSGGEASGSGDSGGGEDELQGSCVYVNPFSMGEECREYRGGGWSEADQAADCAAQMGTASAGACEYPATLGACVLPGEADAYLRLVFPGDDPSQPGEATTEPTFGLPAKWIAASERARAEAAGCTVVDPTAVIATHLAELIRKHAHELLGRREAQELFDVLGKTDGKVVEELIPHLMSTGDVIKVLRNLLREGVSIRDLRTILETLADHAGVIKHPDELTELVRQRLARRITRGNLATDGSLRPLVLDPRAEQLFREPGGKNARALSRLTDDLAASARELTRHDEPPLLVVAPDIRRTVASIAARHIPGLVVMSYREVDATVPFVTRAVVSAQEQAA